MARLLFNLGHLAARRAKTVIAAWFALLMLAVVAVAATDGELTTEVALPGMQTLAVRDQIAAEISEAEASAGVTGNISVRTIDDEPFDSAQKDAIRDFSDVLERHEKVTAVTVPFDIQEEFNDGRDELSEGWDELVEAEEKIDAGWEEIVRRVKSSTPPEKN